jgi:hypothetical protein
MRHLREHQMPPITPLFIYLNNHTKHHITDRIVTDHLCLAGTFVNQPHAYTIGALRNTRAQALLQQAQLPLLIIKLLGRWTLGAVFRYLTTHSEHLMAPFAETMLQHHAY